METKKPPTVVIPIRWLLARDHRQVLEIEQLSFDDPWTRTDFVRCLLGRNCVGMVADYKNEVVGFMVYELFRYRIQVLDFAVHPSCRLRGIGRAMVDKLKAKLSEQRRSKLDLICSERSLGAQLFFQRMGFRCATILHGHHVDGSDAFLMRYKLPKAEIK